MGLKKVYVKEDTHKALSKIKSLFGTYDNTLRFILVKQFGGLDVDEWINRELFKRKTSEDKGSEGGEQHNKDRVRVVIK